MPVMAAVPMLSVAVRMLLPCVVKSAPSTSGVSVSHVLWPWVHISSSSKHLQARG